MGIAYELLAESYKAIGNIEESKRHLEALLSVAEEGGKDHIDEGKAEAALKLGLLEYEEGSQSSAVSFLEKHFEFVRKLQNSKVLVDLARINLGIAKANYTIGEDNSLINREFPGYSEDKYASTPSMETKEEV